MIGCDSEQPEILDTKIVGLTDSFDILLRWRDLGLKSSAHITSGWGRCILCWCWSRGEMCCSFSSLRASLAVEARLSASGLSTGLLLLILLIGAIDHSLKDLQRAGASSSASVLTEATSYLILVPMASIRLVCSWILVA
jgi:hypothetical protein